MTDIIPLKMTVTGATTAEIHEFAAGDTIPAAYLPGSLPIGMIDFFAGRSAIPAGWLPLDGQALSRTTYPDMWSMISASSFPTVSDSVWTGSNLQRANFSTGDGSTTFRLADYNGKSSGSAGPLFLRGDGLAVAGSLVLDAFQGHLHGAGTRDITPANSNVGYMSSSAYTGSSNLPGAPSSTTFPYMSDTVNGTPRTANETRPMHATGVWCVRAFGAVTNSGSANAAQLATDLAALATRVTTLESSLKRFVSAEQTITAAGALTIPHGLGAKPFLVVGSIICKTAELGYAVADEPIVGLGFADAASSYGVSVIADATNLNIRYGSQANVFIVGNKGTGAINGITLANWRFKLSASL